MNSMVINFLAIGGQRDRRDRNRESPIATRVLSGHGNFYLGAITGKYGLWDRSDIRAPSSAVVGQDNGQIHFLRCIHLERHLRPAYEKFSE